MKLIIDISDEDYNVILANADFYKEQHWGVAEVWNAIVSGVPLPKGHGRLVDENHVIAELVYRKNLLADNVTCGQVTEIFDSAVVVEADKESNNGTDN